MTPILIFKILTLLVLVVLGVSLYGASETIRVPSLAMLATPGDFDLPFEAVTFPTSRELTLSGWFVPADHPSPVTLIILHGVGSNSGDMLPGTLFLRNKGQWNLFYFDFRGHGNSDDSYTSVGPLELEDLRHAVRFVKDRWPEATRRLGIYGHSMGAAVAIVGASEIPELEAVVAESSFARAATTIRRVAWKFYRIPYFPFVPLALFFASLRTGVRVGAFSPASVIGKISPRPILMLHGELDRRMTKVDVRALWDAAREPKELWTLPLAGHGDAWLIVTEPYEKRLVGFFEKTFRMENS